MREDGFDWTPKYSMPNRIAFYFIIFFFWGGKGVLADWKYVFHLYLYKGMFFTRPPNFRNPTYFSFFVYKNL